MYDEAVQYRKKSDLQYDIIDISFVQNKGYFTTTNNKPIYLLAATCSATEVACAVARVAGDYKYCLTIVNSTNYEGTLSILFLYYFK